jgi:hypothetical protein
MASTIATGGGVAYTESLFTGYNVGWGQSFAALVSTKLASVTFFMKKTGAPTGNMTCKIYTLSGVYGSTAIPNTLLATSDVISIATLGTSAANVTFTFSGAQKINITSGTNYFATVEYSGGDGSNYGVIYFTNVSGYGGNGAQKPSSSWAALSTYDFSFTITGDDVPLVAANSISSPFYYLS